MLQLNIANCNKFDADLISDLLENLGALSVTMTDQYDDPILEPEPGSVPLWPNVVLHALYEPESNMDFIIDTCSKEHPHISCTLEMLPDQDWERTCLVDLEPKQFGSRLWICPSWITPPDSTSINLILDPGLAFGTGSHPTTALCLTWLEQADLMHKTVIDYGCGSGILGISSLKLGAAHVYAVDIDEQALIATKNNAITNQIEMDKLDINYPNGLHESVDILIANILLTPLINLKVCFNKLIKKNGILVLSGILANQIPELVEAYKSDFTMLSSSYNEDWALLCFTPLQQE